MTLRLRHILAALIAVSVPLLSAAAQTPTFSTMTLNGGAGTFRTIFYSTGGSLRWREGANNIAETGGNAGSDWVLRKYNDDGTTSFPTVACTRSTNSCAFTATPTVPTLSTGDNSTGVANGLYVTNTLAAYTAANYFPLTGGTIQGNTTVGNGLGATTLAVDGAAGNQRLLRFNSTGVARWALIVGAAAETGGNAGSNFFLESFNDDGTFLANPISCARQTSLCTFVNPPIVQTAASADSSTSAASTAYVQKNTPWTQGVGVFPVGTGSYIKIGTVTVQPTATQNFVFSAQVTQAFAGGATNWGLKFRVDNATDVNAMLSSTPQSSASLMGTSTLIAGSHTIDLYWLGQNSNVTFTAATISAQSTQ